MACILLIDDNRNLRNLLRVQLEGAGHRVLEAANGDEALRVYQENGADLVLCDLFMPGKEGLETIRELHERGESRIIAMSGDGPVGSSDLLRIAQVFGAARALSKPFDGQTLLDAVGEVLAAPAKEGPS
ncbi:MAG TPA: response regulator [Gemmataceae bacterium]|nr:response regulator [Gemmataceae bacterium]